MESWRWSLLVLTVSMVTLRGAAEAAPLGTWRMITENAGISAMHAALTPGVGSVVLMHHTNTGPSNLTFPDGIVRNTTYDHILKSDPFAHSVILDPVTGKVRPLMMMTDAMCSAGQFLADGTLEQAGGDYEGKRMRRTLSPECYEVEPLNRRCDWVESPIQLKQERWYSTAVLLPEGRQILFGGRGKHFSNEFSPPTKAKARYMPFLNMTSDGPKCDTSTGMCVITKHGPNNYYPYAYLLPITHQIYIFANRDSIIFNYHKDTVVRTFPQIPGNARNYPSGGSSVMLPLQFENNYSKVEVVVCGGATNTTNINAACSMTCGRMEVTSATPEWAMEAMPIQRCMGDMIMLPDMNVLIINGAQTGYQSWKAATTPVLSPVLYEPAKAEGERFTVMAATAVPRVYHSTATLLTDGSVMVAGSSTHKYYTFNRGRINPSVYFPTELSVEAFTPPYAGGERPTIVSVDPPVVRYNGILNLKFHYTGPESGSSEFLFTMNSSPWSTHSYSHGQRVVTVKAKSITTSTSAMDSAGVAVNERTASLVMPRYTSILPPAYYSLWVVKNGNPSKSCVWVRVVKSLADVTTSPL